MADDDYHFLPARLFGIVIGPEHRWRQLHPDDRVLLSTDMNRKRAWYIITGVIRRREPALLYLVSCDRGVFECLPEHVLDVQIATPRVAAP